MTAYSAKNQESQENISFGSRLLQEWDQGTPNDTRPVEPGNHHTLYLALLFVGVAGVLFFRLGEDPSRTSAERRCRQVITGMVVTGDWLTPMRNGAPHLTKPPLFYWHAVFWSRLWGRAGRFQQRFPSVLCALGLVALTYLWGRSVGGLSVGLVSAACLVLMHRFYASGRQGTYDMQLALLCVAALLIADQYRKSKRQALAPIFALLTAMAFLTKGPPAFLFIGLPIFLYLLEKRQLKWIWDRRVWPWLLLIIPLCLAWFVVLIWKVPQSREIFLSELLLPFGVRIGRTTTGTHYNSPLFYILQSPLILFPAVLLLPLVIREAWKTRGWRDSPSRRLCFWAVIGPLVVLSIVPQKQHHYLLPLLAPLSVLYGITLVDSVSLDTSKKWLCVPTHVLGAVSWVAAGVFIFVFWRIIPESVWLWGSCTAVLLGAGWILLFRCRQFRRPTLLILSVLITWSIVLSYYGSLNTWHLQFKHGVVFDRSDYQAEQWESNFERYPWLRKMFHDRYHRKRIIETP